MARRPLQSYHLVWLSAHPSRSEKWLVERLADGFQVHHVDGDHRNDLPENLVLIDGDDHIALHSGSLVKGIANWRNRGTPNDERWAQAYELFGMLQSWRDVAKHLYPEARSSRLKLHDISSRLPTSVRKWAARNDQRWPIVMERFSTDRGRNDKMPPAEYTGAQNNLLRNEAVPSVP